MALIRDNIERSGLTNITAVCQAAAIYDPHKKETADIVIADLPCSGLGVDVHIRHSRKVISTVQ